MSIESNEKPAGLSKCNGFNISPAYGKFNTIENLGKLIEGMSLFEQLHEMSRAHETAMRTKHYFVAEWAANFMVTNSTDNETRDEWQEKADEAHRLSVEKIICKMLVKR